MADGSHIAYLFSRYPVVSQTFCDTEMLALERLGLRLSVASLNPPPTSFRHERLRRLDAEIHYPPPSQVLKEIEIPPAMQALATEHAKKYPRFKIQRARNAAYFARLFARLGIDHVHVHFANQATWTALFLKAAGFPFSFTAHAQDFMVDLGSDDLLREMAAGAEFVVAVSDYSRELLRQTCPQSAHKIHRVYNGIEIEAFSPLERPRGGGADPRAPLKIISIGRLIEFKGFHHLIEAVHLLGKRGLDAELQIVGDGPWRERLENQIASLELASRVKLRGVLDHDEVRRELASSDVFALACCVDEKGATDVLPTVITEAMAMALPVVSTRLAGVPEMVEDGVTGLLVEPANPEQLAEALARLAADPQWCAQLGAAGRRKAQEIFSLDRTAGEVKRLFNQHVRAGPPPEIFSDHDILLVYDGDSDAEPGELFAWVWGGEYSMISASLPVHRPGGSDFLDLVSGDLTRSCPERLEFLPHGIVLESLWEANGASRETLEALSSRFDAAVMELFFRDARRAVYLAEVVRKRGIRHLHAWNDSTMLWAWLVKQVSDCTISFTIGTALHVPFDLVAQIAPDFDFGNAGHSKLRQMLDGRFNDDLGFGWQEPQPRIRLGPFRFGTRAREQPKIEFTVWLRQHRASLSQSPQE